jgi:hypothetical protein
MLSRVSLKKIFEMEAGDYIWLQSKVLREPVVGSAVEWSSFQRVLRDELLIRMISSYAYELDINYFTKFLQIANGLPRTLEELDLSSCGLDRRYVEAWVAHRRGMQHGSLGSLLRVGLGNNRLTYQDVRILSQSGVFQKLQVLSLSRNPIGDVLRPGPQFDLFPGLQFQDFLIDLSFTNVTSEGMVRILNELRQKTRGSWSFFIHGNPYYAAELRLILEAFPNDEDLNSGRLVSLSIDGTHYTPEGMGRYIVQLLPHSVQQLIVPNLSSEARSKLWRGINAERQLWGNVSPIESVYGVSEDNQLLPAEEEVPLLAPAAAPGSGVTLADEERRPIPAVIPKIQPIPLNLKGAILQAGTSFEGSAEGWTLVSNNQVDTVSGVERPYQVQVDFATRRFPLLKVVMEIELQRGYIYFGFLNPGLKVWKKMDGVKTLETIKEVGKKDYVFQVVNSDLTDGNFVIGNLDPNGSIAVLKTLNVFSLQEISAPGPGAAASAVLGGAAPGPGAAAAASSEPLPAKASVL